MDEMRKAFEAWYVGDQKITLTRAAGGDSYKFMAAQTAWITWQAAHTRAEAETVRRCVQIVDALVADDGSITKTSDDAYRAIRAAFPHVKE